MLRRRVLRCTASLLGVALLAAPAAAQPPAPEEEEPAETAQSILSAQPEPLVERLMQEKVVVLEEPEDGLPSNYVQALVLFGQPRRRALRLLSQTARQTEFRPELKRVQTLEWTDSVALDEHRMKIMFMKIDYRLRTHFDFEAGRIWWELDPTFKNDLESVEGFWELFEVDDDRTLGRFGTRVNVGPTLPVWLQEYATRKNLPQTMDHVRRWVDSNGTYRP